MKHRFLAKKNWKSASTPMAEAATFLGKSNEVINLSIGDPDFITHDQIIEAAMKDAKLGHTKYTQTNGDPELIREIATYYKTDYNLELNSNEIMAVVGACHGMYLALETIIDDDDEIIVPEPYFTPYKEQIGLVKGKMVPLITLEEEGFNINPQKLEALINERTKAILINSPNNPTGAYFNKELLEEIAKLAIKHDLLVLSDEVYDAFIYEEKPVTIASISGMKERTILMGSFSKAFAMTGWRIGYVIAPDYIIACMKDINEGICFTAPSISQRAAIHALKTRHSIQPEMIAKFQERIFYCYDRINKIPALSVIKPKAGIYLFVNIKGTGYTSFEFTKLLMEKVKVAVIPGNAFGNSGEGYIRIACTVDVEKLKIAFDRIESLLKDG
jgi:aspartate/methionine/tyrosine aminotransferase